MAVYLWCPKCQRAWERCTASTAHAEARTWRADFRLGGTNGERIRRCFTTKLEAEDCEHTTITDFKRGVMFPNTLGEKRTFGECVEHYRTHYLIPNEQLSDLPHLSRFIEFFGARTLLSQIDQEACKSCFAQMAAEMQPASVVRRWTLLINIFRENKKWCPVNPAKGIISKGYRKKANRPKTEYFTDEEYLRLRSVITSPDDDDVVVVFRNTGLRKSEGERLAVEHCDFTTNTIHIFDQKNQEVGTVPMVPEVRQRLLDIMRRKSLTGGRLLNMQNITRRFRRLVQLAGLYKPYPYNKTLHSLRHAWGTYIQKNYKDIGVTQKLMRHKTVAMTMRYAHAANEMLKSAALAGSAPTVDGHNMAINTDAILDREEKDSVSS